MMNLPAGTYSAWMALTAWAVEAAGIPDRVLTEYLNAVRGGTTANYLFG